MLVDILEEAAAELKAKKEEYRKLNKQYKKFYSKDLRQEMELMKADIGKIQHKVNEHLYDNLEELGLIKRYFPDLYNVFLDDEDIGKLVKKKDWLLERKEKKKATEKLNEIKEKRKQVREARKFLKEWPGPKIDAKSLTATWPVLKDLLKGEMEKDDVLLIINKKDKSLKKEGWLLLTNESMVQIPLNRFLKRIIALRADEQIKALSMAKAQGKGTVKEFDALKEFKEAQRKRISMERKCRHLLLASRKFLQSLKKPKRFGGRKSDIELLADQISLKKINEKDWLKQMRKRLET